MSIRWPQGKHPDKFRRKVSKWSNRILTGKMLAIDPASGASSMPGWALYDAGKCIASGEIPLSSKKPVQYRLAELLGVLATGFQNPLPDVVVIEEIRGRMAHHYLLWSIGVTVSAFPDAELLEIPVSFWKCCVPEGYEKSDEEDAKIMGQAVVLLAKELDQ